jgi:hypothetical protein
MSQTTFPSENKFRNELIEVMVRLGAHPTPIETAKIKLGVPDLNYVWNGKEFWWELKIGDNGPHPLQQAWMRHRWDLTHRTFYIILTSPHHVQVKPGYGWESGIYTAFERPILGFELREVLNRIESYSQYAEMEG